MYFCVDSFNNLVVKWVDNSIVLMITTSHRPHDFIQRVRRRPRSTATNKRHVKDVWGDHSIKNIEIPRLIDDYNKHMGVVDLADQRISSFAADLLCRRNWIPIMLQCIHIMRNNSFVVYRDLATSTQSQKDFLLEFLNASYFRIQSLRNPTLANLCNTSNSTIIRVPTLERRRMSSKNPKLDQTRLDRPLSLHTKVIYSKQLRCEYCKYAMAHARKSD